MPTEFEIVQVVRQYIADNFLFRAGAESISDADSLLEGRVIDSMGVLELITFVEERFAIRVEDSETIPENLDSIARIAAFVQRKLQVAGEPAGVAHAR